MRVNDKLTDWFGRALGVLLAIPFLQQATTIPDLLWIFMPVLAVVILAAVLRFRCKALRLVDPLNILLLLNIIGYAFGMIANFDAVSPGVKYDFLRGIYFSSILSCALVLDDDSGRGGHESVRAFAGAIAFTAVTLAILGALKYRLLLDDLYIPWIASQSDNYYPSGTSLVIDYNFYSLTLLVGALILLKYWLAARGWLALIWAFCAGLIIIVGYYTGSRRFGLLLPLVTAGFFILTFTRVHTIPLSRWCLLLVGTISATIVTMYFFSTHVTSDQLFFSQSNSSFSSTDLRPLPLDYSARIRSLREAEGAYGLEPRIERLKYALGQLDLKNIITGGGFQYRAEFGCRFAQCQAEDYPHNPVISALMYGGILAFIVALGLMWYAFWSVYVIIRRGNSPEIALAVLSTSLYVLISGDTYFSIPAFLAALIIGRVSTIATRRADRVASSKEGHTLFQVGVQ